MKITDNMSPEEIKTLEETTIETSIYQIPVSWTMFGVVHVEAKNLKEAIDKAEEKIDAIPLPGISNYLDDSFKIDIESAEDAIAEQEITKTEPAGYILR